MPTASSPLIRPSRPLGTAPRRPDGPPLVLGIDPGLDRTGYGAIVIDGRLRVYETGVLVTRTRDPLGDRLRQLYRDMDGLVGELRPDLLVLEDLFVHRQFPRTALLLGHARGVIYLAAAGAGVPVLALAPSVVKQAVVGSGRATKAQVQAAVGTLLGVRRFADSHAADALALAYAGTARLRTRRR